MTSHSSMAYQFDGYRLDAVRRQVLDPKGKILPLSSRAFDTLLVLLQHQGDTLTKDFLMRRVWPDVVVEENNLNQAISLLRKSLADSKQSPRYIQTISGRGYRFLAPVETAPDTAPLHILPPAGDTMPASQASQTSQTSQESRLQDTAAQTPQSAERHQPGAAQPVAALPAVLKHPRLLSALLLAVVLSLSLLLTFGLASPSLLTQDEASNATQRAAAPGMITRPLGPSLPPISLALPDSVAVLPFAELNPPTDNPVFAAILYDEVIQQLTRISSLKVIARDNVQALAEDSRSAETLARQLRAQSLLSGKVMYLGGRARVSLQLVDAQSGLVLWSNRYDAQMTELSDMFNLQADIARNVAQALESEISPREAEIIDSLPTTSFEAYRYLLAAKNAYFHQDFLQTWTLAGQALALDPDYIDAHNYYSMVNTVMTAVPVADLSRHDHFQLALDSAEAVIALAPEDPTGYTLKAGALGAIGDWEGVHAQVEHLKTLGVAIADMKFYGPVLLGLGDFDTAIRILEANLQVEPINLYGRGFLMSAYELSGERELAREAYRIGEELNPVWWGDTVNLFLALGRNEAVEVQQIEQLPIPDSLKQLLLNLDDRERLGSALAQYDPNEENLSAEAVYYSALAAYIGQPERALDLMRHALDGVWLSFFWLWLPVFDEARQLPAFHALLEEAGIVDYWRRHGWPEVCQPQGGGVQCHWQAFP